MTATSTADRAMAYWPTPDEIADNLVYGAMEPRCLPYGHGLRILEPSAGDGALVRAVRRRMPEAWVTAVEPDPARADQLRAAGIADEVVASTLEDYLLTVAFAALAGDVEPFDLVVANPPFALPGRPEAWAEHLLAIATDPYLLTPGTLIAAIVPRVVLTGKSRRVRQVRSLTTVPTVQIQECPTGSFAAAVSTALIWFEVTG